MIERTNMPMNILCKTKCLISLLFLLFLLMGSLARSLFSSFSYHPEGHATRKNLNVLSNAKVIQALASNKDKQTNLEEILKHPKPTLKNIPYDKYNSMTKVSSKSTPSIPRKLSEKEGHEQVDGLVVKVSSKSMPSQQKQVHRRRLRRHQDIDAFVAYADYRGPRRHPPKNN